MAFICGSCHYRYDGTDGRYTHFSGSVGPCEDCGKYAECHNCYCSLPPRKSLAEQSKELDKKGKPNGINS